MCVSDSERKSEDISEYHKIELEETFERIRSLIPLRVQIFSFIGTAHLTMLGFAFTAQKIILIFLAASLMILLVVIDSMLKPVIDVVVARGLQIEKIYSKDEAALCSAIVSATFMDRRQSNRFMSKIREARTQDEIVRLIQSRPSNQVGVWLPLAVIALECIGGLILWGLKRLPLI
jgi:hypothetical protein